MGGFSNEAFSPTALGGPAVGEQIDRRYWGNSRSSAPALAQGLQKV